MNEYKVIDLQTWPRRESFEFYRTFVNPSYCINVLYDIQPLYALAKSKNDSFFLLTLYALLRAANEVEQLRQRYVDGQVIEFNRLAVMTPILTKNEQFRQIWCEYESDFYRFKAAAAPMIAAAKQGTSGPLLHHGDDYICASCVPWLHFAGATQADLTFEQTVPILAWAKMQDGKVPICCRFNHYFVDGLHFSRFFNKIEASFQNPESLYCKSQDMQY
ncbi:MAG: CatA-like O-acetyltransferase [Thermoguttaceae bacterium]|nr:CatA-like O-acetyltransferase [Thermoguttaceae bacterium]